MKISAVEAKVLLSHEWNYIYTCKDILLNNANSPPLLQSIPQLAEVWQYFVITVTAVKVLICIDKLPLLYSPKASCYLCIFFIRDDHSSNISG
jgi:hypothetical protein